MLVTPTHEQLRALANVREHSWWPKVDELITAEIQAAQDRMLESVDTAHLHELRGWIKGLRDFQSTAREASKTLEKLRVKNPL